MEKTQTAEPRNTELQEEEGRGGRRKEEERGGRAAEGGRVKVMRAKERRRGNKAVRKEGKGVGRREEGVFYYSGVTITPTAGPLHL